MIINSLSGILLSRHQIYTEVIDAIDLWQSIWSNPTPSRHFPQFTICSVRRKDIWLLHRQSRSTYNFQIGIPMLLRYSDRCRINIDVMQFCGLGEILSTIRRGIDIPFLHQQSRVKYAILISLRYQHFEVGPSWENFFLCGRHFCCG